MVAIVRRALLVRAKLDGVISQSELERFWKPVRLMIIGLRLLRWV